MPYRFAYSLLAGSGSCSQSVNKTCMTYNRRVYSEKSPGGGHRNCPKHVQFYSKNKFDKISASSVGFIIRIVHPCDLGVAGLREEAAVGISCDGNHIVCGRECNYSLISGSDDCRNIGRYGKWQKYDPGREGIVCVVFWRHDFTAGTSEWLLRRPHSCGMHVIPVVSTRKTTT